jgi:oligopeptide transport system ATP-binding protein
MSLLEVVNLNVKFNILDGVVNAVNDVSFVIKKNEILGIVGESGSGKSVAFLSLFGLIPQPPGEIISGKVIYKSENIFELNNKELLKLRSEEIGFIYQDPLTSLNPVLKIINQIIESIVLSKKISKSDAFAEAKKLLNHVGIVDITNNYNSYPHQYSGGMRQRAMIAMAIANNPNLLIADEPTTALDVTIQAQIIDLIKKLKNEIEMSIVWISHDLGVIAGIADRVIVMYAGYIVEEAPVFELYKNPKHPYTKGLLNSVPRINSGKIIDGIEGIPPDGLKKHVCCPFSARCSSVMDKCFNNIPPLKIINNDHRVSCFL